MRNITGFQDCKIKDSKIKSFNFKIFKSFNQVKVLFMFMIILLSFGLKCQDITDTLDINQPEQGNKGYIDSLTLYFKTRHKTPFGNNPQFTLKEIRNGTENPRALKLISFIPGGEKGIRSDDIVLLLVDISSTMENEDISKITDGITSFFNAYHGNVYISTFGGNEISNTRLLQTKNLGATLYEMLMPNRNQTGRPLNNAIWVKLREMIGETNFINLIEPEYKYDNDNDFKESCNKHKGNLYMLVVTGGDDDINGITKYKDDVESASQAHAISPGSLEEFISKVINDKVKIFCLSYQGNSNLNIDFLKTISKHNDKSIGYIPAFKTDSKDQLDDKFIQFSNNISYSYRAYFKTNQAYTGEAVEFKLKVTDANDKTFEGKTLPVYGWGSSEKPLPIIAPNPLQDFFWGSFWTFITIIVTFFIIQLLVPLIRNKTFDIKYITDYKSESNTLRKKCIFCGQDIYEREKIVIKCKHPIHKACWADNNHMCPEFGQNCSEGKQDYFDITDPFSKKNKKNYLTWVVWGLLGGFIVWTIFIFNAKDWNWGGLTKGLINLTHPDTQGLLDKYKTAIPNLLTIGMLMGFFLTILFIYTEEYRKKTTLILLNILLRGIIGSIIGFISFFIGSLIIIIINQPVNPWTEWIPWIIFGSGLGFSLSVKTTIHWKHGLLGGLASGFFSFIILYFFGREGFQLLFSLMLYGAALGFFVATIRAAADQYFLKVLNGPKEGANIAIYKWLGSHGALNHIFMGRAPNNEISINWEKQSNIAEKHVKIYINKTRNIPVIVSVEKGKITTYNGNVEMITGKEYELLNGVNFKIGDTTYQYFER